MVSVSLRCKTCLVGFGFEKVSQWPQLLINTISFNLKCGIHWTFFARKQRSLKYIRPRWWLFEPVRSRQPVGFVNMMRVYPQRGRTHGEMVQPHTSHHKIWAIDNNGGLAGLE